MRDAIGATRPEIRVETQPDGSAGVAVGFPAIRSARDVARLAPEVFALPARLADARRRRVVVALDEFQAIGSFNGGSVEEALRAAVQHQRQVGYVFAGSEPSLMEAMLGPKRPFYKAGPVMRLQKIPPEPFAAFIEQRGLTGLRLLADLHHLELEHESQEHVIAAAPLLAHVHVADGGRRAPGLGGYDYAGFMAAVHSIGYDRRISAECQWENLEEQATGALAFMRGQWESLRVE